MINKPKYCKHCDGSLKIRAEFILTFEYGMDKYKENCCPMHVKIRMTTLKKNYNIVPMVTELPQPVPMLWT